MEITPSAVFMNHFTSDCSAVMSERFGFGLFFKTKLLFLFVAWRMFDASLLRLLVLVVFVKCVAQPNCHFCKRQKWPSWCYLHDKLLLLNDGKLWLSITFFTKYKNKNNKWPLWLIGLLMKGWCAWLLAAGLFVSKICHKSLEIC